MSDGRLLFGRRTIQWFFSVDVLFAVLQILLKAKAWGATISADTSHFHIDPLECYDRTTSCKREVEKGFCDTNYHYMIDRCPWSCRFCRRAEGDTMKCQDLSQTCSEWVSQKECSTHPDFMAQNCKLSCELCDPESELELTDQETGCPIWAKAGGCQQYINLIHKCPHSCQKYAGLLPTSRPENYNTFQNTSSTAPPLTSSQFTTPQAPSAAIRTYSDVNALPMDLQKDLGNDLWNDKLLSLTRKQNEYVTHPKSRTPALPSLWPTTNKSRPSNTTAQVQNGSLVIFRPDGLVVDGVQQNSSEMVESQPAQALPARTYDSLLPKLAVSGPSWSTETGNEGHAEFNSTGQERNSSGEDIWEEEREEDLDADENGQQKGDVPLRWTENDNKPELREKNKQRFSSESGEQTEWKKFHPDNGQGKTQMKLPLKIQSSGSGDKSQSKHKVLHMFAKRKGRKSVQKTFILGSGIERESWKLKTAGYISLSNQNGEEVNVSDEMSSGSGKGVQEGSSLDAYSTGRRQE